MVAPTKIWLLIAAACVAGPIFWSKLSIFSHDPKPDSTTSKNTAFTIVEKPGVESERISPPSRKASGTTIVDAYSKMGDGRKFVVEQWGHPDGGGRLYASYVTDGCAFVKNFTEDLANIQPDIEKVGADDYIKASEALKRIQLRCGQFSDAELLEFSKRTAFESNSVKDKLIQQISTFAKASSGTVIEEKREAMVAILLSKDPLVIDQLGARLLMNNDLREFTFDDIRIPYSALQNDLVSAMELVPCNLGLQCDSNEFALLLSCAGGSGCYASRADKILQTIAQGDDTRMKQIIALSNRITLAIESNDVQKFLISK